MAQGQTISREEFEQRKRGGLTPPSAGTSRPQGIRPPSASEFFLENVPESAVNLVKSLAYPIMHPIEAAKGIGSLVTGGISAATGLEPEARGGMEEGYQAFVEGLKERYGSTEALSRTAYEDPLGMAADASAIASVGGAGLRAPSQALSLIGRGGRVAKGLAKAGEAFRGAGQLMDPIQLAAKAGTATANRASWILGEMVTEATGMTTGVKSGPTKMALRQASPELKSAMRGNIDSLHVLQSAKEALGQIKEFRSTLYRSRLRDLPEDLTLDLAPIKKALTKKMEDYNIRWTRASPDKPPKLDFSRSTISSATDQRRVRQMIQDVNSWGSDLGDTSVMGVDTLRRRLDDFYAESGQARALTTDIAKETRKVLDDVPGYTEMTADYAETSSMIKEIETEMALKKGAASGASLRKLMTTFSENSGYRKQMVDILDRYVTDQLGQQIAGLNLSSYAPAGLVGRGLATAGAMGAVFLDPSVMSLAVMSSPRIVGEILVSIHRAKQIGRGIQKGVSVPAKVLAEPSLYRPAAYTAGLPPPPSTSEMAQ